jgi:hypothetical protein
MRARKDEQTPERFLLRVRDSLRSPPELLQVGEVFVVR